MNTIDLVESARLRDDIPDFRPGDTVKVHVKVAEAGRERIQVFQGVVLRRQNGGLRETFTVRKISFGVGVERTFPIHSPTIGRIEVVTRGKVRRAKLYYLRDLRGKAARIRELREPAGKAAAGKSAAKSAAASATPAASEPLPPEPEPAPETPAAPDPEIAEAPDAPAEAAAEGSEPAGEQA